MRQTGKAGADHATDTARLAIFDAVQDTHELSEKRVAGHRLFLAVPKRGDDWPVLYMLDGNAAFDFLTPEHLALVPDMVLVGVGYDTERQFARERRTLDFTPPDGDVGIRPDHVHEGRMAGGADQFLAALTGPLRAAAEKGLPIDPARRALWGHSFGGLFTLYARLVGADFGRFASISPSIWWDQGLVNRIVDTAVGNAPLMMALGDREQRSGVIGPPPNGPAPATMALAARLSVTPHVLPGLRHIETLAGSFPLALPFAQS